MLWPPLAKWQAATRFCQPNETKSSARPLGNTMNRLREWAAADNKIRRQKSDTQKNDFGNVVLIFIFFSPHFVCLDFSFDFRPPGRWFHKTKKRPYTTLRQPANFIFFRMILYEQIQLRAPSAVRCSIVISNTSSSWRVSSPRTVQSAFAKSKLRGTTNWLWR